MKRTVLTVIFSNIDSLGEIVDQEEVVKKLDRLISGTRRAEDETLVQLREIFRVTRKAILEGTVAKLHDQTSAKWICQVEDTP